MSENQAVGHVIGALTLTLGEDVPPIELGKITLPLKISRVTGSQTQGTSFGIAVDLDMVKSDIRAIFRNSETESGQ